MSLPAIPPAGETVDLDGHQQRAGNAVSDPAPCKGDTLADVVLRTWQTFLQRTPSTFASNANVSRKLLYVIGTMRALVVVLAFAACGDNNIAPPSPDAPVNLCDPSPCEEAPTCESLGCPLTAISLLCVQYGGEYCTCDPDGRGPAEAQVCTYPGSTP